MARDPSSTFPPPLRSLWSLWSQHHTSLAPPVHLHHQLVEAHLVASPCSPCHRPSHRLDAQQVAPCSVVWIRPGAHRHALAEAQRVQDSLEGRLEVPEAEAQHQVKERERLPGVFHIVKALEMHPNPLSEEVKCAG